MKTLSIDRTIYQLIYCRVGEVPSLGVGHRSVKCLPGHVAIELLPVKEKDGSIYLPQEFAEVHRNDVGLVVSAGEGVPLFPGDLVVVLYGHGKRVKRFTNGIFESRSTMVFTGCAGGALIDDEYGEEEPCSQVPWWESIPMRIDDGNFVPLGRNVLLELTPVENSEGGIALSRKRHECDALVASMGPDAFEGYGVRPKQGNRVVFDEGAVRQFVGTEFIVVPDWSIHAIV